MADRIGQHFGEYRLTCFLGRGSFGDVYLGEHLQDRTLAAVKVLQARLTNEDLKEFINEASATFRLKHPHIVQLLDFGVGAGDALFLVMAYAPNGTLRKRYPKGTRLPLDTVVSYVNQIAEALQYAHDRKLIHRDVKPENILLGLNNELLLSDFGLAIVTHSSRSLGTQNNAGTIVYMAPEQIRGRPCPASDQYALGIIAYEWLCGARPFNGTAIEIAMQHLLEPPPSLCEKVPSIASGVEQVVMTALAKDPQQRFASMQAFAQALTIASQQSSRQKPSIPSLAIPKILQRQAPAVSDQKDALPVQSASLQPLARRPLWAALLLILLLLLIFGGINFALPGILGRLGNIVFGIPTAAIVTVTPVSSDVRNTYTIYGVTGTPDITQRQAQARLLTSSTSPRSKTVQTTATRTAGTRATGTLTFYNSQFNDQRVNAGTDFALANGVHIITNRNVDIPKATGTPPNIHVGTVSVSAHAGSVGPGGNITPLTINHACCSADSSIFARNLTAFTGGLDPQQGGPFVQQSDIDNASKSLENMLIPGAQQSLQVQVHPNEYYVNSPQCTPTVTTDHSVGDKATDVTVTIKVTCSGEVYDQLGAQAIAADLLKQQATKNPGHGYALVGNLVTAILQVRVSYAQKGTLSLLVKAEGIWVFQFDDTQKQALAKLVAGKSRVDAQSLLLKHLGVASADIMIRSGNNTLTTDSYQISIVVQNVPGLQKPVSHVTSP
jgi:serine/threonine protein kinase